MKILWITNQMMPPVFKDMGMKNYPRAGWMYSSLKRLVSAYPDAEIAVACLYGGDSLYDKTIDGVRYFCLPDRCKDRTAPMPHLRKIWSDIRQDFNPDVVHIHGSEFTQGYEWCEANGFDNVAVSIQGMISAYERHYLGDVKSSALRITTLRDLLKRDRFPDQVRKWKRRSRQERSFLSKVKHIIGRTDWDRSHTWALNPVRNYYYGGETLRDSFYRNRWDYSECTPHTIFLSQGSYPIKGVDVVFKALPLVLREFPDTKVRIAGHDIFNVPWYRRNAYSRYLLRLLDAGGLRDKISFTGLLSEEEMCAAYLDANLFICPSSIENSPNSLGEAQMLRMPHLASFVGGVPEITDMNREVLYRFEEYEMLADKICTVFRQGGTFKAHEFDESRYDGERNTRELMDTYRKIVESSKKSQ